MAGRSPPRARRAPGSATARQGTAMRSSPHSTAPETSCGSTAPVASRCTRSPRRSASRRSMRSGWARSAPPSSRRTASTGGAATRSSAESRSAALTASGSPSAAEQRRAGVQLASVLAERPGDDDALLALLGQAVDLSGHAAEHDLAAARPADRVRAGAVDRGPDHLGRDLVRHPRRRVQVASRHGAGVDAEAVVRPDAAGEALGEVLAGEADVVACRLLRLRERDGGRHVHVGRARTSLGDQRLPVEEQDATVLLGDGQRPVERRRQPQRHLRRPVDEGREQPRRVAAVAGVKRAAVATLDREGVFA